MTTTESRWLVWNGVGADVKFLSELRGWTKVGRAGVVTVMHTMSWSIRDNEGGTAIRHRPFLGAIFYFIVGDFANMIFWEKGGRAGDMPQSPERGAI